MLVLPTEPPHFNVDEFIAAEAAREKERQEHPNAEEDAVDLEMSHDHIISFAARGEVSFHLIL